MVAAVANCAATGAPAAAFSFALLGDAPYGTFSELRFAAMLREIGNDHSLQFVLHVGDLKGSNEPCSDDLLRRRVAQLQAVPTALVYTPGDNDWTDCHRAAAGGFDPLERLVALRRIAYPDPRRSLGQRPLPLQSQADTESHNEFVENALFTHEGVVFVTLHVVGSNNGLEPWRGIERSDHAEHPAGDRIVAFERRQAANLAWLETAFARAETSGAPAVVILMQANPRFDLAPGHPRRAGFETVIGALRRLALRFGRPVLLAHGDMHFLVVDRPLAGETPPVSNLLRVQTYGEPLGGWVRIDVDPRRPEFFRVRPGGEDRVGN